MTLYKVLLKEDDCSPDAREYFEKDLVKITGMNIHEFKTQSEYYEEVDNGFGSIWKNRNYILEIYADDPFYELSEIVENA